MSKEIVRRPRREPDGRMPDAVADYVRAAFNAMARKQIRQGAKRVSIMERDMSVVVYTVKQSKDGYALLTNPDGLLFGVDMSDDHKEK